MNILCKVFFPHLVGWPVPWLQRMHRGRSHVGAVHSTPVTVDGDGKGVEREEVYRVRCCCGKNGGGWVRAGPLGQGACGRAEEGSTDGY
jgi:hypothetical protein